MMIPLLPLSIGLFTVALAQIFDPSASSVLFAAWCNPYEVGTSPSPATFNQAIGLNTPIFLMSQSIPLDTVDPTTGIGGAIRSDLIEATQTDAAIYLTVYPNKGFEAVTDTDISQLTQQIASWKAPVNRTVLLRYAPEMQGNWFTYGLQPTAFVQSWRRVYTAVKAVVPDVFFVWGPNTPQGYPWGQGFPSGANAAADRVLLDTNNDGTLDSSDDPFSPFYPGEEYVDIAGLSI
ncbi:glycoside hydrolase family 26 protein [Atractiella rhizophila]|nr:glycoside hydrolase family 26 protein [Atractiella rhizophila]